jgi:hypothetical protein
MKMFVVEEYAGLKTKIVERKKDFDEFTFLERRQHGFHSSKREIRLRTIH